MCRRYSSVANAQIKYEDKVEPWEAYPNKTTGEDSNSEKNFYNLAHEKSISRLLANKNITLTHEDAPT